MTSRTTKDVSLNSFLSHLLIFRLFYFQISQRLPVLVIKTKHLLILQITPWKLAGLCVVMMINIAFQILLGTVPSFVPPAVSVQGSLLIVPILIFQSIQRL